MADLADMAVDIEAEHIAAGLRRITRNIPAGVAGECDDCGEQMPRLVDGRCGFCRDGRRPPLDRYRDPSPKPSTPKESITMPSLPINADSQTISVPAKGKILEAIRRRAEEIGEPLGRTVIAMVEEGLVAHALAAPPAKPVDIGALDADELVDELRRRLDSLNLAPDLERDLHEVTARACAAEAKLVAITELAIGEPPPGGARFVIEGSNP